jgi:hypothetical protein
MAERRARRKLDASSGVRLAGASAHLVRFPHYASPVQTADDGDVVTIEREIALLFVLPIPIASISWTVTHEEVFREPRDWCAVKSQSCQRAVSRKFFYLFTCEYCFSHYVTAAFLYITRYQLLFEDWRGYVIAGFSLVWIANVYMSFFGRLRLEIREDRMEIAAAESRESRRDANGPKKRGQSR